MSKFCLIASFPTSVLKFRGELLRSIAMKGLEVHIILPFIDESVDPGLREKLNALGYQLHEVSMQRTGLNPVEDFKTLWQIYKKLQQINPDYVLAYTIKPVVYGMFAARFAKVPRRYALITGLGYAFQGVKNLDSSISKFQKIIFNLYRLALNGAHKVIFQNPDDLQLFKLLGLVNSDNKMGLVNGSGVDTTNYIPVDFPKDEITNKIIPKFLLIARLLGDKGVREFATAAQSLQKKYPHAQFSLVGWIDSNPDAIKQEELNEWVNSGVINFFGKLEDVRPVIEAHSVYVLPSYREGTPRTVLEAMSMGRPIITTDAPGCKETVVEGENGFLVKVKSASELEESMEKFILQPELISQMGEKSREIVELKYDVDKVNESMLKVMDIK